MTPKDPDTSAWFLSCLHFMQYLATIPLQSDIGIELVNGTSRFFKQNFASYAIFHPGDTAHLVIQHSQPDEKFQIPPHIRQTIQVVCESGFPAIERVEPDDETLWVLIPVSVKFQVRGVWTVSLSSRDDLPKDMVDGMLAVANFAGTLLSHKETDLALIAKAEQLQLVADYTYDWEFWLSPTGQFMYCSPSCERVTGYSRDDFTWEPGLLLRIVHHEDTSLYMGHVKRDHNLRGSGDPCDAEFRIIRKDGEIRWLHHICVPVFNYEGHYVGQRGSNRDITDRKLAEHTVHEYQVHLEEMVKDRTAALEEEIVERTQAEEALRRANKKLNLLSSITRHDINNQLMSINGFLELLHKKVPDPTLDDFFNRISRASDRISTMIQFTKEYEQIGVNVPVWQDIRTLIDTGAKDVSFGNIKLINDIPAAITVYADPLIVKVFFNLMDNAVRYGGKITTLIFSIDESGDEHIILCEDDGDGIPSDEKEKIFEKGFGKNTGLGLFLSREILAITGISIRENGEPGKGARFEITVPEGAWRSMQH